MQQKVNKLVTKQKWSLAAYLGTQEYSEDKGWWGRKKVFIKMLHNLGILETPQLWAHFFHKSQKKSISSQKD